MRVMLYLTTELEEARRTEERGESPLQLIPGTILIDDLKRARRRLTRRVSHAAFCCSRRCLELSRTLIKLQQLRYNAECIWHIRDDITRLTEEDNLIKRYLRLNDGVINNIMRHTLAMKSFISE